jgi:hypothetical protein
MFHYLNALFYGSTIPEAPPLPSPFEEELVLVKSKLKPQLGRNKPKQFTPSLTLPKQVLLREIKKTKNNLKKALRTSYKGRTYLPRHPVLLELLTTIPVVE